MRGALCECLYTMRDVLHAINHPAMSEALLFHGGLALVQAEHSVRSTGQVHLWPWSAVMVLDGLVCLLSEVLKQVGAKKSSTYTTT